MITAHHHAIKKCKYTNQQYLIDYQPVGLLLVDVAEIGFLVLEDLKYFSDPCESFHV
jgi:hypothetical protein